MNTVRYIGLPVLLALCMSNMGPAQDPKPMVSDSQFRKVCVQLLDDPVGPNAKDHAKLIMIFTIQTPKAAIMLGKEELPWFGKKEDDRGFVLLAAYSAGNALSQLNSGVKRNDRYSGLLYLFQVYRTFQAKEKGYKIDAVDNLLRLHREDKLLPYLAEVEKKQPSKLTPEDEEAIKKKIEGK
jgi:hypothetical protein